MPFCDTHCTHSRKMENRHFITSVITDKAAAQFQYVREFTLSTKLFLQKNMTFQKSLNFHCCRIARPVGSEEFPVFCRYSYDVKNLGTGYFLKYLTGNCLQLAQVRRSVFLRRPKNRLFRKICLWAACMAVFTKPVVPKFLHRGRAVFVTDKLCHTYRGSVISPVKLSLLLERLARFFFQLGPTSKAVRIKCQTPNRDNAKW